MKVTKTLGILVLIAIVLFSHIQLIPYGRNHTK